MPTAPLAGRYELGRAIGRGGMAEVWQADDLVLGRRVAVKTVNLAGTTDPTTEDRLRREAVATAALEHPDIVSVYDAGVDGDTAFLVMELLPGRDLAATLREGPLELGRALHVASRIAGALEAAHDAGIVHRDIKPANILVDGASVSVVDFGIAAVEHDAVGTLTIPGTTFGTAEYMSPEQARGEPVSVASDMYSFGCLLTTLVAGRAPFTGEPPIVLLQHHTFREPPTLTALRPEVPAELDDLVAVLLAKDPGTRPSAHEAKQILDRLVDRLGGEPAPATAPDPHRARRVGAAIAAVEARQAGRPPTARPLTTAAPTAPVGLGETGAMQATAARAGSGLLAETGAHGATTAAHAMPGGLAGALAETGAHGATTAAHAGPVRVDGTHAPPAAGPSTAQTAVVPLAAPAGRAEPSDGVPAGPVRADRRRRGTRAALAVALLTVAAAVTLTLDLLPTTLAKGALVEAGKPTVTAEATAETAEPASDGSPDTAVPSEPAPTEVLPENAGTGSEAGQAPPSSQGDGSPAGTNDQDPAPTSSQGDEGPTGTGSQGADSPASTSDQGTDSPSGTGNQGNGNPSGTGNQGNGNPSGTGNQGSGDPASTGNNGDPGVTDRGPTGDGPGSSGDQGNGGGRGNGG